MDRAFSNTNSDSRTISLKFSDKIDKDEVPLAGSSEGQDLERLNLSQLISIDKTNVEITDKIIRNSAKDSIPDVDDESQSRVFVQHNKDKPFVIKGDLMTNKMFKYTDLQ